MGSQDSEDGPARGSASRLSAASASVRVPSPSPAVAGTARPKLVI
jgi:hypothetical protein